MDFAGLQEIEDKMCLQCAKIRLLKLADVNDCRFRPVELTAKTDGLPGRMVVYLRHRVTFRYADSPCANTNQAFSL